MDSITQAFYRHRFEIAFLRKKGNAFQDFFADIMEKAHQPGDFVRVRPWGKEGDRKNDGYLTSTRTLFQVYAPNEMSASKAVAKMDEDFRGALAHWAHKFDHWVFVHNSVQGVGPQIHKKSLELEAEGDVSVRAWGYEELHRIVETLDHAKLELLFGFAPTRASMMDLGLDALMPVLEQITAMPPQSAPDLRPPPADKLQRNMLSPHVTTLLTAGMARVDLLVLYFRDRQPLRDEIAEAFHQRYVQLRDRAQGPDAIFTELQRFAGGSRVPSAAIQSAVLAVLAFFFEACDIFERDAP